MSESEFESEVMNVFQDGDPEEEVTPDPVEAPPEDTPEEAPPQVEEDPDIAALLAKYGNDPMEALRGTAHLQRKIGEQGSEMGSLREELAALRQTIQGARDQPPPFDEDAFDEKVVEDPGGMAQWAAQTYGVGSLPYERAMETWYEIQPRAASKYETDIRMAQERQSIQESIAPALKPIQESYFTQQITNAYAEAAQKHADIGSYVNEMNKVMMEMPAVLTPLADPNQAPSVIESLYYIAKGRVSGQAPGVDTLDPNAEKISAAVASATSSPNDGRLEEERHPLYELVESGMSEMERLHDL